MSARVSEGWSLHDIPALVLEIAALRVTLLPELGGHVVELVDKVLDCNLLWSNPRTQPRLAPYGAHFDDWWSEGLGRDLPDGRSSQPPRRAAAVHGRAVVGAVDG